MKKTITLTLATISLVIGLSLNASASENIKQEFVKNYSNIVYQNYLDSYNAALKMQKQIEEFLKNPTESNLAKVKESWLEARTPYSETEAFRFYEGPIDFVDQKRGIEGPEGRLNAWPLDEAYIDYVQGNPKAGIVNNQRQKITTKNLIAKNQQQNEENVATGYHAIEFLLWGQDLSLDSAGMRPASDYANIDKNQRRRKYLSVVTDVLIEDLHFLVEEWKENENNYAKKFNEQNVDKTLSDVMTALATLSGFELASERMATSLDSSDQEDEHSCFSDNTHNDFIDNIQGISNVFFGEYKAINSSFFSFGNDDSVEGVGLYDVIASKDEALAKKIKKKIKYSLSLAKGLHAPIDQILASKHDSKEREKMEKLVSKLQELAELLKKAGKTLGVKVEVLSE